MITKLQSKKKDYKYCTIKVEVFGAAASRAQFILWSHYGPKRYKLIEGNVAIQSTDGGSIAIGSFRYRRGP